MDFRRELSVVELDDTDRTGPLRTRLEATRGVHRAELGDPDTRRYPRALAERIAACLLYTSPSPRDRTRSRMPSSA